VSDCGVCVCVRCTTSQTRAQTHTRTHASRLTHTIHCTADSQDILTPTLLTWNEFSAPATPCTAVPMRDVLMKVNMWFNPRCGVPISHPCRCRCRGRCRCRCAVVVVTRFCIWTERPRIKHHVSQSPAGRIASRNRFCDNKSLACRRSTHGHARTHTVPTKTQTYNTCTHTVPHTNTNIQTPRTHTHIATNAPTAHMHRRQQNTSTNARNPHAHKLANKRMQTHALAVKSCAHLGVVEVDLAGGRAVAAHLVLDAADVGVVVAAKSPS
jgi:hypothetical protein